MLSKRGFKLLIFGNYKNLQTSADYIGRYMAAGEGEGRFPPGAGANGIELI